MRKRMSLPRRTSLLVLALAALLLPGLSAWGAEEAPAAPARADVVIIDVMANDGRLELPAVVFLHDKHTEALKAAQKDCSSCHEPLKDGDGKTFSFTYKNADQLKGDPLKSMFHESCIGCHVEMRGSSPRTGMQEAECRSCHKAPPPSERLDAGLDKAAHYAHVASKLITVSGEERNCAACHHVYDAQAQKLAWSKDKEDSCRACHMRPAAQKALAAKAGKAGNDDGPEFADENGRLLKRPDMESAVHASCVNCHLKVAAVKSADQKTGPSTCAGCHGAAEQAARAEGRDMAAVPRLERGQDDAVLMLPRPVKSKDVKGMMRPVSFNHKFHEAQLDTCRVCHHKKISACSDCHSYDAAVGGNSVNFAEAMHRVTAERSCVGCHLQETRKPACIGCHAVMPTKLSDASCASCHATPAGLSDEEAENGSLIGLAKDAAKPLADATVAAREHARVTTLERDAIPEKAVMGLLEDEYKPSELPHRKIVETLLDKQKDSRLAAAFHTEKTTLCQGCHHNSPASATPPKCAACHGVNAKAVTGRLPLKAAYHQQCITCHEGMQQKPLATECADCHKTRDQ